MAAGHASQNHKLWNSSKIRKIILTARKTMEYAENEACADGNEVLN